MQTLTVDLDDRSYPIWIGSGLLDRPDLYAARLPNRQVLLVSNTTVAEIYLERVRAVFADREAATLVLPDGEAYKTLDNLGTIFSALLERRFGRDCALVALGGGVIGDMAGFAAATYQRGVDFVQVPTTLLAQVDSSVGGKTAVNHPLGKNMIGAFHQPRWVLADIDTLRTLPHRELSAGLAEIIKYGVIADAGFFGWLEANIDSLRAIEPEATAYAVHRSCAIKAAIVAADEREKGQRALLNLGHTFGHAIEAGLGYGQWLHGEAVGAGMAMAAYLAMREGELDDRDYGRLLSLLERAGLPDAAPAELDPATLLELMRRDKKVRDGHIRLVLPRGLGRAEVTSAYAPALLEETLEHVRRPRPAA